MKNEVVQKLPPKITKIGLKSGKEFFVESLFVSQIIKVRYQNEGMIFSKLILGIETVNVKKN